MSINRQQLVLVLVALTALLARLHHLDAESFFMDEIHQAMFYAGNMLDTLNGSINQQQPPLDYILGHFIYQLDSSDFALRLPAALFGTGSAVLIALLCGRALSALPGDCPHWPIILTVGLLAALLPYPIYVSQDIRPYSSATFFLLLLLLVFDNLLRSNSVGWRTYAALGLTTLSLLLSRTLAPLVICLVLGLILFLPWLWGLLHPSDRGAELQRRRFLGQSAMVLALLLYTPYLYLIVASGGRFLNANSGLNSDWPLATITASWAAQMEPFSLAYLVLPLVGVFAALKHGRSGYQLPALLVLFFPSATIVHFLVFHSMTAHPFRAPYAIYAYPSLLLLGAVGTAYLLNGLSSRVKPRLIPALVCVVCLALLSPVLLATAEFKHRTIKTDWRGLTEYLDRPENAEHVWISHTLANGDLWSPHFFGLERYPSAPFMASTLMQLSEDPQIIQSMGEMYRKPVLVIFVYRDYYLTQHSTVPIMPLPPGAHGVSPELQLDPAIQLEDFNGLVILSLKESRSSTRQQLLQLITLLLDANEFAPYLDTLEQTRQLLQQEP